jgi:hypothetical protein
LKRPDQPSPAWRVLNQPEISFLDETPRQEERSRLLGKIAEYLTVSVFVLTVMVYEWAHWYFKWTPHPLVFAVVALGLVSYALVRILMLIPKLRAISQEADAAGSYQRALKELTARGWYVFQQVRDTFDRQIGTWIVGAGGVYCVTLRYPSRKGKAFEEISEQSDGQFLVSGHPMLGNPREQASKAVMAAYALLADMGLETVPIQGVLVFPTWKITTKDSSDEASVWILNEGDLVQRLKDRPPLLEPKTVIELCTALEKLPQR